MDPHATLSTVPLFWRPGSPGTLGSQLCGAESRGQKCKKRVSCKPQLANCNLQAASDGGCSRRRVHAAKQLGEVDLSPALLFPKPHMRGARCEAPQHTCGVESPLLGSFPLQAAGCWREPLKEPKHFEIVGHPSHN